MLKEANALSGYFLVVHTLKIKQMRLAELINGIASTYLNLPTVSQ